MVEKVVECPGCKKTIAVSGEPGEVVRVKCSECGLSGKVTFEKELFKEEKKPVNYDRIDVFQPAIMVNNLKKVYGELIAVNNISFKVKKGEVFAFLGPNGAGKTTTVEMIENIRKPNGGDIFILGNNTRTSFSNVKEKIGILPQEFRSFDRLKVKETLEYFAQSYKKQANIDEIIKAINLKDEENKFYKDLSGGLKQRVGVAISLVNDPEIIFLDEPTTGLDPKARREVWDVIASLRNKGKTIFLTTHYMEEAEYLADHIAIIFKGEIIAEGSLEELIDKYGEGVVLKVKNCKDENAKKILEENGFSVFKEHNGDISVRIDYKEKVLEVLSILKHQCVNYDNVDIRRSNLEEIFLKLTGSKLREANS